MSEQPATESTFQLVHEPSFSGVIHGVVQTPDAAGARPTVVVCHGFKGFFEWGFFPPLADLLVQRGYTVVRFNYSGSGQKPGDDVVTDLEAFRRNTFSLEVQETLRVLEALDELAPGRVDLSRLAIIGHSRGGAAAVLASAAEPWRERLRALVTWASISSYDIYRRGEAEVREKGYAIVVNGRTGQELKLGPDLLNDLDAHPERLDVSAAAARRRSPWLILHGTGDETVSTDEARVLARAGATGGEVALELIEGAGHTFGAQHPFTGPTPDVIRLFNATQTWLREHCW
ncbi:MAG: alpha/beta fold hydrolase [Thermoanaerobaculia bacterium]|nr:alpha/beta fold hydrolase [Thermoanaerobaculia bacterium]